MFSCAYAEELGGSEQPTMSMDNNRSNSVVAFLVLSWVFLSQVGWSQFPPETPPEAPPPPQLPTPEAPSIRVPPPPPNIITTQALSSFTQNIIAQLHDKAGQCIDDPLILLSSFLFPLLSIVCLILCKFLFSQAQRLGYGVWLHLK